MNTLPDKDLFELLMETRYELAESLCHLTNLGDGEPLVQQLRDEIDIAYSTLITIIDELRRRGQKVEYPKVEPRSPAFDTSLQQCRTGSTTE